MNKHTHLITGRQTLGSMPAGGGGRGGGISPGPEGLRALEIFLGRNICVFRAKNRNLVWKNCRKFKQKHLQRTFRRGGFSPKNFLNRGCLRKICPPLQALGGPVEKSMLCSKCAHPFNRCAIRWILATKIKGERTQLMTGKFWNVELVGFFTATISFLILSSY